MKQVDVVVPCYNYGSYLDDCVNSVLCQTHENVRILIIDDASSDDTPDIAQALCRDQRVIYRRHKSNQGHVATFNEGLDWASADYTLLLSADDVLTLQSLERSVKLMESNPEVGMTYGLISILTDDSGLNSCVADPDCDMVEVIPGLFWIQQCCIATRNLVATPTAIVRTEIQKRVGGYDPSLPHTGDLEMWLRIASCSSIGFINEHQAWYRKHSCNMHKQFDGVSELAQVIEAMRGFVVKAGNRGSVYSPLVDAAQKRIAIIAFWRAYWCFAQHRVGDCRKYLEFSTEMDPGIIKSRDYHKLKVKLLCGVTISSFLSQMTDGIRRTGMVGSAERDLDDAPKRVIPTSWI